MANDRNDEARGQAGFEDNRYHKQSSPEHSASPSTSEAKQAASALRLAGDWHRCGAGLSVRFEMAQGRLDASWKPRLPTRREFQRIAAKYRRARTVFIAEVAARLGGAVACIEVDGPSAAGASGAGHA